MNVQSESQCSQDLVRYQQHVPAVFSTGLDAGENILVREGNRYSLLKFEKYDVEIEPCDVHRYNRGTWFGTSNLLLARTRADREAVLEQQRKEWKRLKGNVYGTHRLDFEFDSEFGIYLPSSSGRDLFLFLARETSDGAVFPREDELGFIIGDEIVRKRLRNIVRPGYFETVIEPFLTARCTKFQMPRRKQWWRLISKDYFREYERTIGKLDEGDFVYIGSKEEVYLLSVAKDDDGGAYCQGSYLTSAKPLLYFSNNYLEFISKHDAEKPKFEGSGACNVARYRTFDVPGFDGKPFIFPQMGRKQNCKNTVFTGDPDVITGDIDQALEHFVRTDFSEFFDVVRRYAETSHIVHESSGEPNGRYYY